MNTFATGFGYLWRGLPWLLKPGIKRFVIIPLLINVLFFIALFWILGNYFGLLVDYLLGMIPDWLQWLGSILWILFALLAVLLIFFVFAFFTNLIGSPFNSLLAAKIEQHFTGESPPGSQLSVWRETVTAISSEARKWLYFLLWAVIVLIFALLLSPLAPVFWFVFGAWLFSLEYLEYPMSNHGKTFPQIRQRLGQQRMLSLGFGCAVTIAMLIPFVNLLVMPMAVAGATLLYREQFAG